MKEENQIPIGAILAFVAGVAIGRNWPKIKEGIKPLLKDLEKQYSNLSFASLEGLVSQKEKFEDLIAEWKDKKEVKKKILKKSVKKSVKK